MKKLILAMGLCVALLVAVSPSAFAGAYYSVKLNVNYIKVYSSNGNDVPEHDCKLEIYVTDGNGQQYIFPAEAAGTLINLALLKAWNEQLQVSAVLYVDSAFPAGDIYVKKVDFGQRTLEP